MDKTYTVEFEQEIKNIVQITTRVCVVHEADNDG